MRRRVVGAALALLALLALAVPAAAYWRVGGSGTGSGTTVPTLAAGQTPTVSVTAQAVTVSWPQTTFLGTTLGTRTGGGYLIRRYASGPADPIVPGAACSGTVTGAGTPLSCTEAGVPFGRWTYTVQSRLSSFTGDTSAASTVVTVSPSAPTSVTATPQNPAAAQTTGPIAISWPAVSGASGYSVYRRVAGTTPWGSPLNATPLAVTSYSDTTAARDTTYEYVVRTAGGGLESADSPVVTAKPFARPAAPTAVTATPAPAGRVTVGWTAPSGAIAGYNVYRGTTATFTPGTPVNGSTLVTGTSYSDLPAADGTYFYVIRAVTNGQGTTQLEGPSSTVSPAAIADRVAPATPTAVTLTSGTAALTAANCTYAVGTKFLNGTADAATNATNATFSVTGTTAGETVVLTSGTATASAVATGATTTVTLNLSTVADGPVTVTATTRDAAGNVSATGRATTTPIVKDTAATFGAITYNDVGFSADSLSVPTECGTLISATRTAPSAAGPFTRTATASAPTLTTFNVAAGGGLVIGVLNTYTVTFRDLAGNTASGIGEGRSYL